MGQTSVHQRKSTVGCNLEDLRTPLDRAHPDCLNLRHLWAGFKCQVKFINLPPNLTRIYRDNQSMTLDYLKVFRQRIYQARP